MNLQNACVVLTGAAGGIGSVLAKALLVEGARVALVDRNQDRLEQLASEFPSGQTAVIAQDLLAEDAPRQVVERSLAAFGHVDVLINLAGVLSFQPFLRESSAETEQLFRLNVFLPMRLTRAFLPHFQQQGRGRIVNVGSIFGSIGFAWFTSYSASKAALRGFSEALRRELAGTGIDVTYVAPRAVKTPFNTGAIYRMAEQVGMNLDAPEAVARQIVGVLQKDSKERYLGFPESFFVRLNYLFPRLVDQALKKQNQIAKSFAEEP
ncbi:MAG: SDR family oxidoreductase [Gammaproteobacteria bacterium]